MQILDKVEDWIVRATLKPLPPDMPKHEPPPKDDGALALAFFMVLCLSVSVAAGWYLAH